MGEKSQTHVFFSEIDGDFTIKGISLITTFKKMSHLDYINQFFKLIMLIAALFTFVILIKTRKKTRLENLFLLLVTFSIVDIISNYLLIDFLNSETLFQFLATVNQYVFYITEVITIITFYDLLFSKKTYWKTTLVIGLTSIVTTILFVLLSNIKMGYFIFSLIIIFELIYINFSFGYFFITNLEKRYNQEIKNLNIINYGFFIFVNFTAPFYFIIVLISKQNTQTYDLSFINHIGYLILYSSLIKSLKCKK